MVRVSRVQIVLLMLVLLYIPAWSQQISRPLDAATPLQALRRVLHEVSLHVYVLNQGTSFPTGFEQYQSRPPSPTYTLKELGTGLTEWQKIMEEESISDQKLKDAMETAQVLVKQVQALERLKKEGGGTWDRSSLNKDYNEVVGKANENLVKLKESIEILQQKASERAGRQGLKFALLLPCLLLLIACTGKLVNSASKTGGSNYWKLSFYVYLLIFPLLGLGACGGVLAPHTVEEINFMLPALSSLLCLIVSLVLSSAFKMSKDYK